MKHVRKKARIGKSKIKSVICVFDSQGIVHTEFVPQGQSVNRFITVKFLKKKIVRVQPSIVNN